MERPQGPLRRFTSALTAGYVALLLLIIGLMLLSFPLGGYIVFSSEASKDVIVPQEMVLNFFVLGRPLSISITTSLATLFAIFWPLYLTLFYITMKGPYRSLPWASLSAVRHEVKAIYSNASLMLALTSSVLIEATIFIQNLQESHGIETGELPIRDPAFTIIDTGLRAPIAEELGFRVTIIGTAAVLLLLSRGAKVNIFKVLWHPKKHLSRLGSKGDLMILYLVALLGGLFFGIAHYEGGWEIGKVTTASLAGVVFGLAYISYGLPMTVLLHWSFNYFPFSFYFLEESIGMVGIYGFVENSTLIVGSASLLFLLVQVMLKILPTDQKTITVKFPEE